MKSIPEPTLNVQDVPRLFSKYKKWIVCSSLAGLMLGIFAASHVPKKYKSHFVLTIYSKYFQSPLVGDFVPGLSEYGDGRSQRESMIRQVLTPEYLDYLGDKYGLISQARPAKPTLSEKIVSTLKTWAEELGVIQPPNHESELSGEREALRARIEVYSLNGTTFNVGFIYSDPQTTYNVIRDIHTQVIRSLLDLRMRTLISLRDAVQRQLQFIPVPTAPIPATAVAPSVPNGSDVVQEDLAEVRNQLSSLGSQYTEEHPLMIQLRDRERILVSRLNSLRSSGYSVSKEKGSFGSPGTSEAGRDIYGDLNKKLNYLNIALDSERQHQADYFADLEPPLYPSAPLWPHKGLFALWGMALGLFGSLFIAALREYFAQSTLHADALAQHLGLDMLGDLPPLPTKSSSGTNFSSPQLKAALRK